MAKFIEARVIQKIDTEQGWNANELILYKGEIALVGDPDRVYNIKVGNGVKKFRDLPYMVDYVNGLYTGVITPQSQVPSGINNIFLVSEQGTYTNFGGVVLPKDNLGIIYKNSDNFTIQLIPIVSEEKLQEYIDEKLVNSNLGFGGEITDLNQSPNVQGMYIPKVNGVYPNFGNLEYNSTEGFTLFLYKDGKFSKITIPLSSVENEVEFNNNVLGVSGSAVEKYAVKKINTIAELRNTQGEYEGQIISLLGYYNKNDKEVLNYKFQSTQLTDDGGSIINNSLGSWVAVFNNEINALDFGLVKNSLSDSAVYIQKSVDYLKNRGGVLNLPNGNYYVSHIDFIGKEYSDIHIKGNNTNIYQLNLNPKTIISGYSSPTFARYNSADGIFVFDSNTASTIDDSLSIKNIKVTGINFISDVVNDKFDELSHQICAYGVSNFKVEYCSFIGFLGDGIAICRGFTNDGNRNAYNSNVNINNCNFDGINKDNRQGISIYYSDGFKIEDCNFNNICRSNMIGAVDVEADDSLTYSRRGYITRCKFKNIGGISGIVFFQKNWTGNDLNHLGYIIDNCDFEEMNTPLSVIGNNTYMSYNGNYNIILKNSRIYNVLGVSDLRSAYGVKFENNIFKTITSTSWTVVRSVGSNKILFEDNSFTDLNNPNGLAFPFDNKNIDFINNEFNLVDNRCMVFNKPNGIGRIMYNKFNSTTKTSKILVLETQINATPLSLETAIIKDNYYGTNMGVIDLYFFIVGNLQPTTSNLKPKHVLYGDSKTSILGTMPTGMLGDNSCYVKMYREKGPNPNYYPSVYQELFPVGNNSGKTWKRQATDNTFENWSAWQESTIVKSVSVSDATSANATDLATAITLVNELKTKLNAKLTADRNSGQQAIQ